MLNLSFLTQGCKYKKPIIITFAIYSLIIIAFAALSNYLLNRSVLEELGNKAMTLAIIAADDLDIDEKELNRLIDLDYNEIIKESINIELGEKMRNVMSFCEAEYVYLKVKDPRPEAKYKVEKNEDKIYNMPVGTALDVVYVLSVALGDNKKPNDIKKERYIDKERYNVMNAQCKRAFEIKEPLFYINKDRWGEYLTGYAPNYDIGGNFIGLVGVDLSLKNYVMYSKRNLFIVTVFALTLMAIGIGSLDLVFKIQIAEKKIEEKRILSNTDFLTGVKNRRGFIEELRKGWEQSINYKMPISLLIIDIDFFKEYNDNYGHLAGDKLLCHVANILTQSVKRTTDFVGRYGGDEFAMILHNTDIEGARKVAMRIMKNMSASKTKHDYSKVSPYITLSIGVASMIATKEEHVQELLCRADRELYKAKKSGRNSVGF